MKSLILLLSIQAATASALTNHWTDGLVKVECVRDDSCIYLRHGGTNCVPGYAVKFTFEGDEVFKIGSAYPGCAYSVAHWQNQPQPDFKMFTRTKSECSGDKLLLTPFSRFKVGESQAIQFVGPDAHQQCVNNFGGLQSAIGSLLAGFVLEYDKVCRRPYPGEKAWETTVLWENGSRSTEFFATEGACAAQRRRAGVSNVICELVTLEQLPRDENLVREILSIASTGILIGRKQIYGLKAADCNWPTGERTQVVD